MTVFFVAVGIVAAFLLAVVLIAIFYGRRSGEDVLIEDIQVDEPVAERRQVIFTQRVLSGTGKRRRRRMHTRGWWRPKR